MRCIKQEQHVRLCLLQSRRVRRAKLPFVASSIANSTHASPDDRVTVRRLKLPLPPRFAQVNNRLPEEPYLG